MSIAPGTRFGPYEVRESLGAGGMGEVYRARDTTLGRDVAIKALPASVGADPERVTRFQREAHLLAALNHPHIATIHGIVEAQGSTYIVLELVEGESLAQRLQGGPIPMPEALVIARQVADALQAAHMKGIIHRDLKPGNVMLTPEGRVKVLDFGLAKAVDPSDAASATYVANSPTFTSPATQMGMILGTAAYMAPEQAKGKAVDKRADVWAFGCLFYEMLTGRRPFDGEDVTDTIAAVMRGEPDWSALPPGLSPVVERYLRRCLEKPAERPRAGHRRHAARAGRRVRPPDGAAGGAGRGVRLAHLEGGRRRPRACLCGCRGGVAVEAAAHQPSCAAAPVYVYAGAGGAVDRHHEPRRGDHARWVLDHLHRRPGN